MSLVPPIDPDGQMPVVDCEMLQSRRSKNASSQIYRLPRDILIEILRIVQRSPNPGDPSPHLHNYNYRWSRIMRVSHYFRQVAVDTPMLWSTIDFGRDPKAWRELCIQRSGHSDLQIVAYVGSALRFMSRIHTAVLSVRANNTDRLDVPAPILRNLKLLAPSGADNRFALQITRSFLGGTNTSLTRLIIGGSGVAFQEGCSLPALQHFELRDNRGAIAERRLDPLIQMLECAEGLQTVRIEGLRLSGVIPALTSDQILPTTRRASLASLQVLAIKSGPAETSALVRSLSLPMTTLAIVIPPTPANRSMGIGQNHDIIVQAWLAFSRERINAATLRQGTVVLEELLVDEDRWCAVQFGFDTRRSRQVDTWCAQSQLSFACFPRDSSTIFPLIETLRLDSLVQLPQHDLQPRLRFMTNIQNVVLAGRYGYYEYTSPLRKWIVGRNGHIKRLELRGCDQRMEAFAQKLKEESIVSEVVIM
jgi:hypothetical protein